MDSVRSVLNEVSGIVNDVSVHIIFNGNSVGIKCLNQAEDGADPPYTDKCFVARFVELAKISPEGKKRSARACRCIFRSLQRESPQ